MTKHSFYKSYKLIERQKQCAENERECTIVVRKGRDSDGSRVGSDEDGGHRSRRQTEVASPSLSSAFYVLSDALNSNYGRILISFRNI